MSSCELFFDDELIFEDELIFDFFSLVISCSTDIALWILD